MTPEFYFDAKQEHVFWCCPHMEAFSSLPNCIWKVEQTSPLTVIPSVRNSTCGCHGWIRDGKWVPSG